MSLLLFIVGYLYVLGTPISKNADPLPHTHTLGGLFNGPQPTATSCLRWRGVLHLSLAVKGKYVGLSGIT